MPDTLRTLFYCTTPITADSISELQAKLRPYMAAALWQSALSPEDMALNTQRLLTMVSADHRQLVTDTHVLTLHNVMTNSFGLINCPMGPEHGVLQIRLFDRNRTELRNFTSQFVSFSTTTSVNGQPLFDYRRNPNVGAYISGSSNPVFEGRIQVGPRSIRDGILTAWRQDSRLATFLVLAGIAFALLTAPPVWTPVMDAANPWFDFVTGFAGRLSSAILYAALTALLFPYLQHRTSQSVVWS